MKHLIPALFVVVVLCVTQVAAAQGDPSIEDLLDNAHKNISNWQMPAAKTAIDALVERAPENPEVLFVQGRYAFFAGEYKSSIDMIDQATAAAGGTRRDFEYLHKLVTDTHEVTKNYKEFRSPNGYFIIRMEAGKDEILVPYAFETLEAAYKQYQVDFGYAPPPPVVVDIYPKAATLAAVSSLTEEEIKTSGTIALCKYNRLMFTSPKALLKGYGWRDTLAHEYAHLVITQRSNNTVPIWMHEGLAKFQERRWRGTGPDVRRMLPSSENILSEGVKKNELITFEQMHPSMAKLPSQEATALAFAEVYTVMEYILNEKGEGVFAEMLTKMRETEDAEKTIETMFGISFARFQREWTTYLKKRPSKAFDDEEIFVEKLYFNDDKPGSDILEIGKKEARDLIHLGELLQARNRYGAAVVEYNKARALIGDRNPILQTRLGQSLITLGRFQEAVDALALSLDYYPVHHNTYVLLGEALFQMGRKEEAEEYFIEAIGINAFDPKPHGFLAQIYADSGREELATRARTNARLLGG